MEPQHQQSGKFESFARSLSEIHAAAPALHGGRTDKRHGDTVARGAAGPRRLSAKLQSELRAQGCTVADKQHPRSLFKPPGEMATKPKLGHMGAMNSTHLMRS